MRIWLHPRDWDEDGEEGLLSLGSTAGRTILWKYLWFLVNKKRRGSLPKVFVWGQQMFWSQVRARRSSDSRGCCMTKRPLGWERGRLTI
jgi:hypothetical protein